MLQELVSIVSLQTFRVSTARKAWLVVKVLCFTSLLYVVFTHEVLNSVPGEVVILLLVGLGANIGVSLLRFWIVSTYRIRTKVPLDTRDNFIIGIDSLTTVLVSIIIVGSVFPIFGLPLVPFLTSLSLFSVASAWLFKEYVTNFIDSYRLMFSKDFLIGDYIKIGDHSKGIITDITFRATKVKTDEGDMLYIPNTTLMNSEVVNYSKVKLKRIITKFSVSTSALQNMSEFEEYLTQKLQDEFQESLQLERVYLRVLDAGITESLCAFEVSTHTYTFAVEDRIHKTVYAAVVNYVPRETT